MVRLSAMGDIIHALPAIAALRCARPEPRSAGWWKSVGRSCVCARARSGWPALALKPLADWVHTANFSAWRRALLSNETWREMASCRRHVRAMQYGAALDLQGAIRSALAAQAAGARIRVGPSQPRESPASLFYTTPWMCRALT